MGWFSHLFNRFLQRKLPLDADENFELMSEKHLIVGLGNPGKKYRGTRHNIGFMAVDRLAAAHGIVANRVEQRAIVGKFNLRGKSIIVAKPQTFMNDSGNAVGPLANYYQIEPSNVLVVYDELDLAFGTFRLRMKGGAGGHNGMRSIINHLGRDFPRLRLGIGRPPGKMPAAAYVLQDFGRNEAQELEFMIDEAVTIIEGYIQDGIDLAMTRHNKREKDEGKGK